MIGTWVDLVARARGLRSHILGADALVELSRLPTLDRLGEALESRTRVMPAAPASPEQLEGVVRSAAAAAIRVLVRWAGPRVRWLSPIFLDEDRRSIRALLRGAAAGANAAERLAGLVPTPSLPPRALDELARCGSASDVVAALRVRGHPLAAALGESVEPKPDLLRLDVLLSRGWAERARDGARAAPRADHGRRDLAGLVERTVDLENAWTAVLLAGRSVTGDAAGMFVDGGRHLSLADFTAVAAAADRGAAIALLERRTASTRLAGLFRDALHRVPEDHVLAAELAMARAAETRSPLGAAPIITMFARLRAELRDLRLIIWRVAEGAGPVSRDQLVTA